MKNINKKIFSLLLLPLLISCGEIKGTDTPIEEYLPTLPEYKDKNNGEIKEDSENVYFDFYELSDFHGAIKYDSSSSQIGIERLSTYLDNKRTLNPGGTILLSGGDMWQGSAGSNLTKGNLVTYAMNVINFDAMTLGNHEFDWSSSWIINNKEKANFPFLAANLVNISDGKNPDFVSSSTILTRGEYKIGVIGTIGENIKDTILASAVEGYEFNKEIETVKSETAKLKEQGCDIVVWSSHNDLAYLKKIVTGADLDVDIIFGGHSHSSLSYEVDGIPMLETKSYGQALSHVELKLNKTTKEVSVVEGWGNEAMTDSEEVSPDSDITLIYDQYKKDYIAPVESKKICKADGKFNKSEELANFAVYSMFKSMKDGYNSYPSIKAAFTNINGGVRKDIESGTVTYGNLYESFPFDNEIVVCETTGRKLREFAYSKAYNVAMYQIIYSYIALELDEIYQFVTTDFLATSTDYFANKCEIVKYTKVSLRDCVSDMMEKEGTIKASDYKTSASYSFDRLKD